MAGRKSQLHELQIKERYSALAEPYFNYLKKTLETGSDKDKKWAVEQLTKAYSRMIPLQGDFEGSFTVKWKEK